MRFGRTSGLSQQKPVLAADLLRDNSLARGLLLFLPMFEGAGTAVHDVSLSAAHATVGSITQSGNPAWVPSPRHSHGLQLVGGSIFQTAHNESVLESALNTATQVTISIGYRRSLNAVIPAHAGCYWSKTGVVAGLNTGVAGNLLLFGAFNSAQADAPSTCPLVAVVSNPTIAYGWVDAGNDTFWHTASMIYDGTQSGNAARLKMVFDRQVQSVNFQGTIPASLNLSNATSGGFSNTGLVAMSYLAIWTRPLSVGEVISFEANPFQLLYEPQSRSTSPPIPAAPVFDFPSTDTIRGGASIAVFGLGPFDGQTNLLLDKSLPSSWTSSGAVTPSVSGILNAVGPLSSSVAQVNVPNDLSGFDAAIDVQVRSPGTALPAPYEVAALEFVGDTSGIVSRVAVLMDPRLSPSNLVAVSTSNGTAAGGAVVLQGLSTTLRLIRSGSSMWAYVGSRGNGATDPLSLDTWTSLSLVGRLIIPNETGKLRIVTRNLTNAFQASTNLSNFTLRSHATINGRLLDNKTVTTRTRIQGNVPAATLQDVGATTVQVFGPSITGVVTAPFTYTLPLPFTPGRRVFDKLRIYTDPALYDTKT